MERDKFVVEANDSFPSANVPFKTYFVTNYLADERETRRRETVLAEQLAKDLELLANEDDTTGHLNTTQNETNRTQTEFLLTDNSKLMFALDDTKSTVNQSRIGHRKPRRDASPFDGPLMDVEGEFCLHADVASVG